MPVDKMGHFHNKDVLKPGELVIWTCNKELRGSIGLVKKFYAELATVAFPEGEWNFRTDTLKKVAEGDTMRYMGSNMKIPTRGFGIVSAMQATGLVSVQFPCPMDPEQNLVVKYVGSADQCMDKDGRNVGAVPRDESGLLIRRPSTREKVDGVFVDLPPSPSVDEDGKRYAVIQYSTRKWETIPLDDLRVEFDVPYVVLKYVDVKTALTSKNADSRLSFSK